MELTEYEEALIKVLHTLTIIYSPGDNDGDNYPKIWDDYFKRHPKKSILKGLTPTQLEACTEDLCYLRDWLVKKIEEEKKKDGKI